jgi:hypothetical protein
MTKLYYVADLINFFGLSFGDGTQQNLCKRGHWELIHKHSIHAGNGRALGVDCAGPSVWIVAGPPMWILQGPRCGFCWAPNVDFVQGPSCF